MPHWGTIEMVFIETSVFTRQIRNLIPDKRYLEMQQFLARLPTADDLILMLTAYSKTTTDNLTAVQIKILGQLVADELKER